MNVRLAWCVFSAAVTAAASDLPRRGDLGATFKTSQGAVAITRTSPGGFAAKVGLKMGDQLRSINSHPASAVIARPPTGPVHLEVVRDGRTLEFSGVLPEAPRESYPGVDVVYDDVTDAAGNRLRTIITHPRDAAPALTVFVAGWLSCDGIEAPEGTREATSLVFRELARQPRIALVRVDKPGAGDSEGRCSETDFDIELSGYRAAFDAMRRYSFIDLRRVVVFGISNGGGFAPLVAREAPAAGYIVTGGWMKTWFEHMLEIERRRLTLSGKSPGEVNSAMAAEAELYTDYLIRGQSPAEIFARKPSLKEVWAGEGESNLYGRPVAYYQQLQKLNLAEAWSRISAPTLVLQGEFDWIMSRDDHEKIAALVNRNRPGAASFQVLSHTGHTFEHFADQDRAFRFQEEPFDPDVVRPILGWLARLD